MAGHEALQKVSDMTVVSPQGAVPLRQSMAQYTSSCQPAYSKVVCLTVFTTGIDKSSGIVVQAQAYPAVLADDLMRIKISVG